MHPVLKAPKEAKTSFGKEVFAVLSVPVGCLLKRKNFLSRERFKHEPKIESVLYTMRLHAVAA